MEERLMRLWLCVALAVVCLNSLWAPAAAQTDPNDVIVLLKLQQAWGSAVTWTGSDPCGGQWDGVICIGNRVISLYLISRGLSGTIPPDISGLTALQNLDLSFNSGLGGELPTELGSLTSLTTLSLQKCRFKGSIPASLGNLKNLTFLALNNNRFSGVIPAALGALSKLTWFDVAYNSLVSPLPISTSTTEKLGLDTWPSIQHYHMNDNAFSGSIPPEMGLNAYNCVHVLLENNQLTGPIPGTFGNMKSLQILSLFNNFLSGPIPSTLNTIVKNGSYLGLHQLRVDGNNLTGTVPVFDALDQLEYIDFSNNPFDPQPFPSWLNASKNTIQSIYIENAGLTGPLPVDLLSYPALQGLFLQNNQINGSLYLPVNLARNLRYVYLQNNQISNIVQDTNAKLPEILLQGNPTCSGGGLTQASPTVCNTTQTSIATKWVSSLVTENTCPFCDTSGLQLNPKRCQCSYPLIVTLEVRAPTFASIDNDTLWDLDFFNQTYDSIESLAKLASMTFERDQLWVKEAFLNASTQKANVMLLFFTLDGAVMAPHLEDLITRAFTLQKVKYGSPFKPEIVNEIIPSQAVGVLHHGLGKGAVIGIAVGAGAGLLLILFLVFLAVKLKRKAESERKNNPFAGWKNVEDGAAPNLKGARWFSFDDIKRMTNNFSDDNVLGEGGYGKVYKGIQAGTGATVAVKRAQEGSKQGAQEFKNEIELLSRVHHNNLVGLVGFCFEKAEQMLVYEYLPNGTLSEWLRGARSDTPLDWDRRLLIALGAARGLAYLHDNADPPIIHRDVKSCNILLDKNLNAKVADFGLSLLVPDEKDANGKPLVKTIKGTMGYLDPEYYMTSVLTTKSDVYSFGVVLLELLTGRPPIYHGGHIVRDVRNKFDRAGMDGVLEVVDPVLSNTVHHELETFVNIALVCVEDTSLERPSMHEVVQQLETLVGPKARLMPGNGSIESKMSKRERRVPLEMSSLIPDNFEPPSGQFSQGSSASQQSSFKYSGGFAPIPVQPK
ncbi:hypothetical protein KC19_12G040100 [Ceratodon purpureus]|uniref:non-specific serine/threonine protein kinase n=1 Tax=Ceratodon purpureus TaxID=3225 RepID=A0A8T0G413_CERPU|nr:hypothetical protein KC19_12G040100 [Ceratodon purpureus]